MENGLTITQAAQELRVSRPTIHYWIKHAKLDSISLMGIQYIPKTQVERLRNMPQSVRIADSRAVK